jgi:hypothetical protein|tara:strand:- start:524 stop:1078 length:555 start_codon:yes stop_codon:yes gene_type:complete
LTDGARGIPTNLQKHQPVSFTRSYPTTNKDTDMTDIQKELLRTFSAGKNARLFKAETPIEPGTYNTAVTVTIEGTVTKKEPTQSNQRTTTGSANIVRYLLDRINDVTFSRLERDIEQIRKGKFDVKYGQENYARRIDLIMPKTTAIRSGATSFNGFCIVEDVDINPSTEAIEQDGMRLIIGEKQ